MKPFNRYDGVETADVSISMQKDQLNAATSRLTLGEMVGNYESFCNDPHFSAEMFPWAKGFAMGYPLPYFQRELKWEAAQKVAFIQSVWAGIDLGTYLVNDVWNLETDEKTPLLVRYQNLSGVLLDGQQRLTTIEQYITNQFPVPDRDGVPRLWGDLCKVERRRFCSITFTKATIQSYDEMLLKKAYDLRAFGGTQHLESERALPVT